MQHDMMRTLAIRMSSQESVKHRERLIINPNENDLPTFRKTVNARLLSITTGLFASFSRCLKMVFIIVHSFNPVMIVDR